MANHQTSTELAHHLFEDADPTLCSVHEDIVGPPSHLDCDDAALVIQHTVYVDGCWCQPVCRAHIAGALAFTLQELHDDPYFQFVRYEPMLPVPAAEPPHSEYPN